eukprot:gnl/Dysnectes_brevis/7620_a12944_327.p1 GENE.gnl/Dysnectes_brevis/7620_a12944_327~~gnl/Dysnectes_brevis/7620_a12944_327.p1  ORF type:complete len:168 (-),score=17.60 gnl/Dysnectes_brevis/7620_a12944_327:77-580(-)
MFYKSNFGTLIFIIFIIFSCHSSSISIPQPVLLANTTSHNSTLVNNNDNNTKNRPIILLVYIITLLVVIVTCFVLDQLSKAKGKVKKSSKTLENASTHTETVLCDLFDMDDHFIDGQPLRMDLELIEESSIMEMDPDVVLEIVRSSIDSIPPLVILKAPLVSPLQVV